MKLRIIPGSELPIYRQIYRQIVEAIAGGSLKPGMKLSSHRDLAEEILIAPLTVKRAYDDLEADGYVETSRGQGTFVKERPPKLGETAKLEKLREEIRRIVHEASLLQLSSADLSKLLGEEWARLLREQEVQKRKEKHSNEGS